MTSEIGSTPAPITTQLSATAELSHSGSWQPEHGSVIEVRQEEGCQISKRNLFCWNWTPRVSRSRAGRLAFFFDRIIVGIRSADWASDLFRPHISLGYSNSAGPADPVAEALNGRAPLTADVTVSAVSLINLNRDNKAYEWTDVAAVPLGA